MANAPCMKCKDRYLGCHGKCTEYKDFYDNQRKANDKKSFEYVIKGCGKPAPNYKRPKAFQVGRI